jgi:acetyltransferase-like isoleucine patch superfamily enzyme
VKEKICYQEMGGGLRRAALANGYTGTFGVIRFSIRMLRNWLLNFFVRYIALLPSTRIVLQRARGVKIGKCVSFMEGIKLDELYPELITIKDYAALAPQVAILTHQDPPIAFKREVEAFKAPVVIGKGAWIGFGAVILPGVTIGDYSIIGAGSMVNKDVPPRVFAAGLPAKVIRQLNVDEYPE